MVLNIFIDGSPTKSVLYYLREGENWNGGTRVEYANDQPSTDSLQMEYFAFIKAIENVPQDSKVNFLSDNQALVSHMNSWRWIPPNKTLSELHKKAKSLLEIKNIKYRVYWCDRLHNYAG